jgi:pimeloyl-ACP methyl ester carboxylesterase
VLLLAEPAAASALIGGLPRHFRSIAPKLPAPVETIAANFNPWIRGFLDALGIPRVSVIVGPGLSAQTLGFAMLEPERVHKLVFLVGGCGDAPAPEGEMGVVDRLRTSGQPLLATPLDVTDAHACERGLTEIAAFLDKTSDQD